MNHHLPTNEPKKFTPGFRSILVSEEAFDLLKKLQKRTYGHPSDPNGIRFDLKDIVSAVILEAFKSDDQLPDRALGRAAQLFVSSLNPSKE